MYPSFVRDAIESAQNYYNYAKQNKTSRIEVNIHGIEQLARDTYILFLTQKLNRPDSVCLSIKSPLIEPEWYAEKGEAYIKPDLYEILQADTVNGKLEIRVKQPISKIFDRISKHDISIVSDLKFLIKNVEKWYKDHGDLISLPSAPGIAEDEIYYKGDHTDNKKEKESLNQKKAVRTALSSNISYIWGAPGTGKTQYVLADCLLTYIKKGERVIVLAPTHNALEQTLCAVIETMLKQGEDINCIYRLGIPTSTFAAKFPGLCDRIDRNASIETLNKEIEALNAKIFEDKKNEQVIKNYSAFSTFYKKAQEYIPIISELTQKYDDLTTERNKIETETKAIKAQCIDIENDIRAIRLRKNSFGFKFKTLFSQKEALDLMEKQQSLSENYTSKQECIKSLNKYYNALSGQIRDALRDKEKAVQNYTDKINNAKSIFIQTFGGYYYSDILEAIPHFEDAVEAAKVTPKDPLALERLRQKEAELLDITESNTKIMGQKQIFAFTVDYFFAHYNTLMGSNPSNPTAQAILNDISHVFLDEAAYCPLIKSGILYSLGIPVTLLGDHMQLEPICEAGMIVTSNIESKIFLWEQSAIYFPQIFDKNASLKELFNRYYLVKYSEDITQVKYYSEENMTTATLPQTHRFGNNLASILDKFVYRNGFHGNLNGYTQVYYLHAKCLPSEMGGRVSTGEANAIEELITREKYTDCVVMTPYKKQRDILQKRLAKLIGTDNVLTVHASQGREWETVILSVVDATNNNIYFTNSKISPGLHTINTAISRVKKNLIIVCDTDYWKKKGSTQLIGAIVTDQNTQDAELPTQGHIKIAWTPNTVNMYTAGIKSGKLKVAISEKEAIYSRFISNITINENKAPYASVEISSSTDREKKSYKTSLATCTCKDYCKNSNEKIPCKHIFALALKLKVINSDGTFNRTISIPSTNVDIIE